MRFSRILIVNLWVLLLGCAAAAQGTSGAAPAASTERLAAGGAPDAAAEGTPATIQEKLPPATFDWQAASRQSLLFLVMKHSFRMTQAKTRRELGGPFFADWGRSVKGVQGWGDGDSIFTNYIAHPMQGGVSGYIQIHNDPAGKRLEFSGSRAYWNSRLRALGWSAAYSTQFELGWMSESAIGNVGKKKGTAGYVDLVVTPAGGLGMIVAEDWLDKHVVQKLEQRTESAAKRRFYRVLFNPQRGLANVLRGKLPWHRDTRGLWAGEAKPNAELKAQETRD